MIAWAVIRCPHCGKPLTARAIVHTDLTMRIELTPCEGATK